MRIKDTYLEAVLAGDKPLLFDGAMGTMLQRTGLAGGDAPDLLCISNPAGITAIHRAYVEAGSMAVTTNTFGANRDNLKGAATVDEVFAAAIACAREAEPRYVAADIGPLGQFLDPLGDLEYEDAVGLFAEQAAAAEKHGADLVIIETMSDLAELSAAVEAARRETDLPVFATMTFTETGFTFLGVSPEAAASKLTELGVDAFGINCSVGPAALHEPIATMLGIATCPVIVQANAGLPVVVDGQPTYTITPQEYVAEVRPMYEAGARILGGCCGTDPTFIAELATLLA